MADPDRKKEQDPIIYADPINGHIERFNPLSTRNPISLGLEGFLLNFDLNHKQFPDPGARQEFWKDLYGFNTPDPAPQAPPPAENSAPVGRFQRGNISAVEDIYEQAQAQINGAANNSKKAATSGSPDLDDDMPALPETAPESAPAATEATPAINPAPTYTKPR